VDAGQSDFGRPEGHAPVAPARPAGGRAAQPRSRRNRVRLFEIGRRYLRADDGSSDER
jgi:hypothetical protein